ncbi:hypothetical protein P879_10500 [Paragonimus westermani]|uniref:Protein kinase domain-containing protein n=1 Tax=Paragonimus westermani TaxID=34504 RepID=A0A8T0CY32_9TREM|nr:hypothetical protein P879_10500 [Paragonimus westermani]
MKFIGCGAFGTVYQGEWHGKAVALKVLNFVANQLLVKEASHLCQLVHPNIVQFYGVCELGVHNTPAIVMEFAHGGPFSRLIADHPSLDPATLLEWAGQIARGMAYLHSDARLVHRDLKSSNILIREPLTKPYADQELRHCTLLITDFGMACRSSELIVSQQSKLGTVAYAAPEVCRQASFSCKSDVWSYGVVLWELLISEPPFRYVEQPRLLYIIAMHNHTLHVPNTVPPTFAKLLQDCWSVNPDSRPSFEEILTRLDHSNNSEFLEMESATLSRLQSQWREAIAQHYILEQEASHFGYY